MNPNVGDIFKEAANPDDSWIVTKIDGKEVTYKVLTYPRDPKVIGWENKGTLIGFQGATFIVCDGLDRILEKI